MTPRISVVSPVYNVEAYVGKMIESVLAQTFQDFEFFLVDDGSPDRCGEILDYYATLDDRIIVIHKENGGAPSARNNAIDQASGEYMYFIDSDDWIEADMLQNLYSLMTDKKADLVVTGFCMEYFEAGKASAYRTKVVDITYDSAQDFQKSAYQYLNNSLLSLPWNKLYKSSIIHEYSIRFPETKWDDHPFNMEYLRYVNKVVFSSATHYHWYRSRPGTATVNAYSNPQLFEKRKEQYQEIIDLYRYWKVKDAESIDAVNCWYAGRLIQCVQEIAGSEVLSHKQKRARIRDILLDNSTEYALAEASSLSIKMKILAIPMRGKNVELSLLTGLMVNFIRTHFPGLFYRLKERDVHQAQ